MIGCCKSNDKFEPIVLSYSRVPRVVVMLKNYDISSRAVSYTPSQPYTHLDNAGLAIRFY